MALRSPFVALFALLPGLALGSPGLAASGKAVDPLAWVRAAIGRSNAIATMQVAMEDSNLGYTFAGLDAQTARDAATILWPAGEAHDFPVVRVVDGKRQVEDPASLPPEQLKLVAAGLHHIDAHEWEQALGKFEEASRLSPVTPWLIESFIGTSTFALGRFKESLAACDRVVAANPDLFSGHLLRARSLIALGQYDDAREELITTLALRPRDLNAMQLAREHALRLGILPQTEPFTPQATVRQIDATHIRILTSSKPAWLAFGVCEAYWIGEMPPRKTGWNEERDRECFSHMLKLYQDRGPGDPPDAQLARLVDLTAHAMFDAFLAYEVGSRRVPDLTLTLDEGQQAKVRAYVAQYILPRAPHVDIRP